MGGGLSKVIAATTATLIQAYLFRGTVGLVYTSAPSECHGQLPFDLLHPIHGDLRGWGWGQVWMGMGPMLTFASQPWAP